MSKRIVTGTGTYPSSKTGIFAYEIEDLKPIKLFTITDATCGNVYAASSSTCTFKLYAVNGETETLLKTWSQTRAPAGVHTLTIPGGIVEYLDSFTSIKITYSGTDDERTNRNPGTLIVYS